MIPCPAPRLAALFAATFLAPALVRANFVEYRHYPTQITRDTDFAVWATPQGGAQHDLEVISQVREHVDWRDTSTPKHGALQWGDYWRRWAEYATDNGALTDIKITATAAWGTISSWEIIPASAATNVSSNGSTLNFTLTGPTHVVVRVNNDHNKMLAIFADPPEGTVNPSDYGQYYFGPDANSQGQYFNRGGSGANPITLHAGEKMYIAAGCVLYSRVSIDGPGVTIDGRGILLDGTWFKDPNSHESMVWVKNGATGAVIKNIKFLDTNWFNFIVSGGCGATMTNVKMLSNQGNSDGAHTLGTTVIDNCFMHVGDDPFVLYNATTTIQNSLVGSVTGAFNVTATINNPVRIVNNVHFRMTGGGPGNFSDTRRGLLCLAMNGSSTATITDFRMFHVDCSPALWCRQLFYANDMGGNSGGKTFWLHDVVVPTPTGSTGINLLTGSPATDYVNLKFRDVYYGPTRIANTATALIQNQTAHSSFAYSDLVEDFEDGDNSDWSSLIGSGAGSLAVTNATSTEDSSYFSGNITYTRTGTSYEYAILRKTTATMGQLWNTYGRTGIRFWIKGDANNNPGYSGNLKFQLREGDNGDRWDASAFNFNATSTAWTKVEIPFTVGSSGFTRVLIGGDGNFTKSAIDQVRFYIPSGVASNLGNLRVYVDNIEAY